MNKAYEPNFEGLLRRRPHAWARIRGSKGYPEIYGDVRFYRCEYGTVVAAMVRGLPTGEGKCESPIFAFHIHGGGSYAETGGGADGDPFPETGTHYDPDGCPHPYHAGDLPPLWSANGYAFSVILTDRFAVEDVIGKTAVIHAQPDDFRSQPSGNAGEKIACGEIVS